MGYAEYDYGIDIWSVGVIFAGLLFGDNPFFLGDSDEDCLACIASVLGSDACLSWAEDVGVELSQSMTRAIGRRTAIPLSEFVTENYSQFASEQAINLLSKMLVINHKERWTAEMCLSHPYFCGMNTD